MPKKPARLAHPSLELQPAETPQQRAEALVVAAYVLPSVAKKRAQAVRALAIDADCVSAHLLLAQHADGPQAAVSHARDAVAAGDRVLAATEDASELPVWFHDIGRPYLVARLFLAEVLWEMGDRPLAMEEAQTVLRLNPADNHGVRYRLLDWLLRAGSVQEVETLLAVYADEASAAWLFGIALHRFRLDSASPAAERALRAAYLANVHVIPMLLSELPMPDEEPDTYQLGDEDEAALYVRDSAALWFEARGAMLWLAASWQTVLRSAPSRSSRRGPAKRGLQKG